MTGSEIVQSRPLPEQARIDRVLASLDDDDALRVRVSGVEQDIERLGNDRRRHHQERHGIAGQPGATECARVLRLGRPIGRELVDRNALQGHVVRCVDFQQSITGGQI